MRPARNTARFSCLWFVVAFAAPGLARLARGLPAGARLVQTFVAAHLVHFATVAALIAAFERAHLVEKPGQSAAILLIGFSLVVGAGLIAIPRPSSGLKRLHARCFDSRSWRFAPFTLAQHDILKVIALLRTLRARFFGLKPFRMTPQRT